MGPLQGIKVLEIAGIGPGPFCAMMLADMGADVVRVDRAQNVSGGDPDSPPADVLNRGRRSIGVDLKHADGVEAVLTLIEQADGLLIIPSVEICPARIATYDDHRMAMSFALAGLKVPGLTILDPGCVAKTYPGFWGDLARLAEASG